MESDVLKYLRYDQLKKKSFKYTSSWTDCLRLIRNIKQHWKDCPRTEPEAMKVDDPQEYFLNLFPDLVLRVYKIARSCDDLKELPGLKEYFRGRYSFRNKAIDFGCRALLLPSILHVRTQGCFSTSS